ncbi:hypothetical protein [Blochmannia endosymbiont of Camponotus (Colobopsis) obliquus]|uniref:hypothetical protein n=1 Tax=Blochmannia endosymbiont of Camponotus (Colobopsis) obliquus TaxID=1505597 RepID=UPI00130E285F|nr:hypothetical protein [Blochmannia endosymbiont of Camponotus (Colobopsis) obliquus]
MDYLFSCTSRNVQICRIDSDVVLFIACCYVTDNFMQNVCWELSSKKIQDNYD